MTPIVSVIIPTYGGNTSLELAVDSVLSQVFQPFEIIVVDDNNPETEERKKTEMLMKKFRNDFRVKYIQHEKNKNGAAARNTGVRASSGKYIAFLDDDDCFLPHKLEKQVAFLDNHPEYGAAYCWRYQGGKLITSDFEGDLSEQILDLSFTPCTCSIMIRVTCYKDLNGFDESFQRHQDFEFLLRFFEKYSIGVVEEPLVEIIGNSVNNQPQGKKAIELKRHFLSTFESAINRLDQKSPGFKKKVWAVHYAALAINLTVKGHFLLLIKMYFADGYKGGALFWKRYLGRLFEIFKYQFEKRR